MYIQTIVGIILLAVAGFIAFKITKSILKTVFLVSSVVVLLILIFGAIVVSDALDFKENFPNQPSLYLLKQDNKIIAGFSGLLTEEAEPSLLSKEELSIDLNNLESALGNNYKIFIIENQAFNNVEIQQQDLKLTKQQIDSLLASDSPLADYIDMQDIPEKLQTQAKEDFKEQINVKDDAEFKAVLFMTLFGSAIDKSPLLIINEFKDGNIQIYPRSATFQLMKSVPLTFLEGTLNKIQTGD